jgi:predicted small integral membrane protein
MFDWMVWTTPVAVFFTCIVLMLIGMTVWELKSPTTMRRGWLPIATTRGDRLFIGLAGKFQEWLGLQAEPSIWVSFVLSMFLLALVMRKG